MLDLANDIGSLRDFKRHTAELLARLGLEHVAALISCRVQGSVGAPPYA